MVTELAVIYIQSSANVGFLCGKSQSQGGLGLEDRDSSSSPANLASSPISYIGTSQDL